MTENSYRTSKAVYLPNFCTSRVVLAVVFIVELTALVLALARSGATIDFWIDLARTSFFLLWVGLTGAGLLCWMGPRLERLSAGKSSMIVLAMTATLVAVISVLAFVFGRSYASYNEGIAELFPKHLWPFVLRNMLMCFVVTGLALRYFYITDQWRRNVEMQARARVHALQARIRPHFLFNSMNTIASLTRSNPARAEAAVQDLSDLFRANLSEQRHTIKLSEEIEVARTYQRIEQLRLGDRLQVVWAIDGLPPNALVPGLLLQPLLENAVNHGIEPQPRGGVVTVTGELSGGLITIVVRNRVSEHGGTDREGNKLALANIRERLALMYGERALVKAGRFEDEYIVTLRFPHIETPQRLLS